ncbi:zinc-binding dehydrogenase [Plantactinospora sp. ZYX-F-223]|uniref:zinc-binding dehydrogenase n=1 Tax=Plantactinospora sp. ZYX-F-223 TaxID=3144103 RepID=UPI0031FC3FE2
MRCGRGLRPHRRPRHRGLLAVAAPRRHPRLLRTAATKDEEGNSQLPVLKLFARLNAWNALPNGKSAHFYNLWSGKRRCQTSWQRRLTEDLTQVLRLLADGSLVPQIAAKFALTDTVAALRLAESRTVVGKVIIVPEM